MIQSVRIVMTLLLVLSIGYVHGGETARIIRDTNLWAEPFTDAKGLGQLKANSIVSKEGRKGGWYKISFEGKVGWVRMSALRLGTTPAKGDSGLASTLRFLETGRSGSSGVTVATGIRGLDVADVANATPDYEAVKAFKQKGVHNSQTRRFAKIGHLVPTKLAYMKGEKEVKPEQREQAASPWDNNGEQW